MKISEIKEKLGAELLCGEEFIDGDVFSACCSDMMSDVLAFPKEHMALLTGLVNPQVMRTADMLDIRLVIFVRGKLPPQEVLDMAAENGITVLATPLTLYIASGILYKSGLYTGTKG